MGETANPSLIRPITLVELQTPVSRRTFYRLLLLLVVLVIAGVFLRGGFDIAHLQPWMESWGGVAPLLFVLIGVLLMSALVPKTVMSLTAGALFGTWLGSGLMLVIAVLAALSNYHIGRWWVQESGGRSRRDLPLSDQALLNQALSDQALSDQGSVSKQATLIHTISEMAAEAGFAAHLLVRLTPVPTMVVSYSMGAWRARQWPYLGAAAVAVIPQSLWVHSGTAATLATDGAASTAQWISIAIATVGGVMVAILIPREAIKRIRQNQSSAALTSGTSSP